MPREHKLKTWPSFFEAIERGDKQFEIRRNDRDFAVGDTLRLQEWDPGKESSLSHFKYTGREMTVVVTYIVHGGQWGIDPAYCVMGIRHVQLVGCEPKA